eukprot:gene437-1078_t
MSLAKVSTSLSGLVRRDIGRVFLSCRTSTLNTRLLGLGLQKAFYGQQQAASQKTESSTSVSSSSGNESKKNDFVEEHVDWLMVTETEKYELGKRWLAKMMGEDAETFTDDKITVREALQYLLPSHLFAKDARPTMKHPLVLYGKRKEVQVDSIGRPLDPGFYTGQPTYHKLIYDVWENLDKLNNLPQQSQNVQAQEEESFYEKPLLVRWVKQHEMEDLLDCKLSESQFQMLVRRLERIVKHPNGEAMQEFLSRYQINIEEGEKVLDLVPIDEDGFATAMGYRKEAIAEVKVKEGSGQFLINTKPLTKYFPEIHQRQQVIAPLLAIDQLGRFDVDAGVIGGGYSGQAGAIRLGLSRALLSFSKSFFQPLEEAGFLMRDSRVVERKKPGRKKARRKFAW